MLRVLSFALLALLSTPAALASSDLFETADVDPCRHWWICPIVRAQPDPLYVCAGLGLGLQGAVVCAYERLDGNTCAFVQVGFNRYDSCSITDRISIDVSTGLSPLP